MCVCICVRDRESECVNVWVGGLVWVCGWVFVLVCVCVCVCACVRACVRACVLPAEVVTDECFEGRHGVCHRKRHVLQYQKQC